MNDTCKSENNSKNGSLVSDTLLFFSYGAVTKDLLKKKIFVWTEICIIQMAIWLLIE